MGQIEEHVLTVVGERTNKLGDTFCTRRRFALKQDIYDEESVEAQLEDGVLDLVVQKKPVTRARIIPITLVPSSSASTAEANETEEDQEATRSLDEEYVYRETLTESMPATSDNPEVNVETVENHEEEVVFSGASTSETPTEATQTSSDTGAWEEVEDHLQI